MPSTYLLQHPWLLALVNALDGMILDSFLLTPLVHCGVLALANFLIYAARQSGVVQSQTSAEAATQDYRSPLKPVVVSVVAVFDLHSWERTGTDSWHLTAWDLRPTDVQPQAGLILTRRSHQDHHGSVAWLTTARLCTL